MQQSRRFRLPIYGIGVSVFPRQPKYANDGGVVGYDQAEYEHEEGMVTVTFYAEESVLDSIAAEDDVETVE